MVVNAGTGLAKVVVISPQRQLELALPEHLPVSSLLPVLLRQGGEDLAADGAMNGGWVLRRSDGAELDGTATLADQSVRDGELLHMVPRRTVWPQIQYDDIVDAIADGAHRGGPAWSPAATRVTALTIAVGVLLLVPVVVLSYGRPWLLPASSLLAVGAVLLIAGTLLSRAMADSVAGALVAAVAMPYALFGGLVLLGGELTILELAAPQVLLGCAALALAAVAGYIGVADLRRLFVAGMVVALGGALAAAFALAWTDGVGSAALVSALFLILAPGLPLVSVRMAKVPMPAVPRDADDLRAADVLPPLDRVMDQVGRSLELLSGALLGIGVVSVVSSVVLASSLQVSAIVLAAVISAAHLLRARMLVAVRQRLPLLIAGLLGLVAAAAGLVAILPEWARYGLILPTLVAIAGMSVAAGRVFARRTPSPYLGRVADILDVMLTLAVGPLTAGVVGLYAVMRGLNG